MKKAVNQWCFPDGTHLDHVFKVSSEAGLHGVELNIYQSGRTGLTIDTTHSEAKEIKKLANEYGLELRSLSNGLLADCPLSSPSSDVRQRASSIIRRQLELASVMEIDTILVVPGRVDSSTSYEECWNRSQTELSSLEPVARRLGVCIAVENVWNKFLLLPTEMARYIDDLSSNFIGAYFDVGNVLNTGYPEHWIRSLGYRIKKVHVKDFSTSVGNISGFMPLLSGDVNWIEVTRALVEINYDDYLTAELTPYKHASDQTIYDASRHMDVIISMTGSGCAL